MRARTTALLAALASAAPVARAQPPRPAALTLRPQDSFYTAGATPDHAMFVLRNDAATPLPARVEAIKWVAPGGNTTALPIAYVSAQPAPGGRTVVVPAHDEVTFTVGFDPAGLPLHEARYTFRVTLSVPGDGTALEAESAVQHAIREPWRPRP